MPGGFGESFAGLRQRGSALLAERPSGREREQVDNVHDVRHQLMSFFAVLAVLLGGAPERTKICKREHIIYGLEDEFVFPLLLVWLADASEQPRTRIVP